MKKRLIFGHAVYYLLVPAVPLFLAKLASLVLDALDGSLGFIIAVTNVFLFLALPIVGIILMRFSLFKWYFDPIAAAEIPLVIYIYGIVSNLLRGKTLSAAIASWHINLADDGGVGYAFFVALFLVLFASTFSVARKNGKSISFRILKLTEAEEKTEAE